MNPEELKRRFLPFLVWLPQVDKKSLKADLIAGLTNAVVVLPQGVAFAMIAGLPPAYGLYTAIIPPIVAGLFGSSRHLISGPTTAISIVVYATISPFADPGSAAFVSLALTLTFLTGLFQFAIGLARLGALINSISHSVVVGFTAAAAILIATSQLKNVLGIELAAGHSFIHTLYDLALQLDQLNTPALITALVTLITVVVFKKLWPRGPGMLVAMVAGGLTAMAFGAAETGIRLVGAIPASPPPLSLPDFSAEAVIELTSGALAVAMLGLIEAVSIARSIAAKSRQRISGNQEFIGQGLSNLVGSFFSCYASSGSFTRSGLNYASGAVTPLSAVFAALSLLAIMLAVAPLAAYLPIPAMGGIVLVVAYNLVDFHHIKVILKASPSEAATLIVTFMATLFLELEFAIYAGVIFSLAMYLNQTSRPRIVSRVPHPGRKERSFYTDPDLYECPQVKIIRIDGSVYFGSVDHVSRIFAHFREEEPEQKHLLIVCSGMNFIDVSAAELLAQEAAERQEQGGGLYMYGVKQGVTRILERGGYLETIGRENIYCSKADAITAITAKCDQRRCASCGERIFIECKSFPIDEDVTLLPPLLAQPDPDKPGDIHCS